MARPGLLIGLGGTGTQIVDKAHKKLAQYKIGREQVIHFGLDASSKDLGKNIDADHAVLLRLPERVIEDGNEMRKEFFSEFPWIPQEQSVVGNLTREIKDLSEGGCGRTRPISKFLVSQGTIERRARTKTIDKFFSEDVIHGASKDNSLIPPALRTGITALDTYVIATLGGGTGSGSFIPLTLKLKNTLGNIPGYRFGIFFLPSGLEKGMVEAQCIPNAYAALKETYYLFRSELDNIPMDLFDLIILVGNKRGIPWEILDEAVIDMLLSIMILPETAGAGVRAHSDKQDLLAVLRQIQTTHGVPPIAIFSIGSLYVEIEKIDALNEKQDRVTIIEKQVDIDEKDKKDLEEGKNDYNGQSITEICMNSGKDIQKIEEIVDEKKDAWNIEGNPKVAKIRTYVSSLLSRDKTKITEINGGINDLKEKELGEEQMGITESRIIKYSWITVPKKTASSKQEESTGSTEEKKMQTIDAGSEQEEPLYKRKKIYENTITLMDKALKSPSTYLDPTKLVNVLFFARHQKKLLQKSLKDTERDIKKFKGELEKKEDLLQEYNRYNNHVQTNILDALDSEKTTLENEKTRLTEEIERLEGELRKQPSNEDILQIPFRFGNYDDLKKALEYRKVSGENFSLNGLCVHLRGGEGGAALYQDLLYGLARRTLLEDQFLVDARTLGDNDRNFRFDRVYICSSSGNITDGLENELRQTLGAEGYTRISEKTEWIPVESTAELKELSHKVILIRMVVGWDYSKDIEKLWKMYNEEGAGRYMHHIFPISDKEDPFVRVEQKKN